MAWEHVCPVAAPVEKDVQALVVYLEDMKVRHLPLEDRKPLRLFDAHWPSRFARVRVDIPPTCALAHVAHVEWCFMMMVMMMWNLSTWRASDGRARSRAMVARLRWNGCCDTR